MSRSKILPTPQQLLLNQCLNNPDYELLRLAYADSLEEAGHINHARLVRATYDYKWYNYAVLSPRLEHVVGWIFGRKCRSSRSWQTFQYLLQVEWMPSWDVFWRQTYIDRQDKGQWWQWRTTDALIPHDYERQVYCYLGRSPNKHNGMWRALKELLMHRKRRCLCNLVDWVPNYLEQLVGQKE